MIGFNPTKLPYDALLTFGAATVTATGNATNILDLKEANRILRFSLVTDVTSHDRADANETLTVTLDLSNNADMSSSVSRISQAAIVVDEAVRKVTETDNIVDGVAYRYARVSYVAAGTTPSTVLECYLSNLSSLGNKH